MSKLRILIDLDCVMADWIGGVARVFDLTTAQLLAEWTPGEYGVNKPLFKALYRQMWGTDTSDTNDPDLAVRDQELWGKIEDTPKFWEHLAPLPWAKELFDLARSLTDDWWVVTSPSRCPACIPGKRAWCAQHLDPDVNWHRRMVPTGEKWLMAKPGVWLIDDSDDQCRKFLNEMGNALTFPCTHNKYHQYVGREVEFVSKIIPRYFNSDIKACC